VLQRDVSGNPTLMSAFATLLKAVQKVDKEGVL